MRVERAVGTLELYPLCGFLAFLPKTCLEREIVGIFPYIFNFGTPPVCYEKTPFAFDRQKNVVGIGEKVVFADAVCVVLVFSPYGVHRELT